MSSPYTPAQNGRAERKHQHITETGLSMIFHASVPLTIGVEAFSTAVHIIKRLSSFVLQDKSNYEVLLSVLPAYDNFHVFGYRVFPCLRDYAANKFSPHSIPCIFMCYSSSHKSFRCLDPISSRVYISRHAQFDEDFFPFSDNVVAQARPLNELEFSAFLELKR